MTWSATDCFGPQHYTGGEQERAERYERTADQLIRDVVSSLEHGFDEDEWADILERGHE